MNEWIALLHKILKDETRRKIILLLNEMDSQSYTYLTNLLAIVSTNAYITLSPNSGNFNFCFMLQTREG